MPASSPTPAGTLTLTVELLDPRDGKETVILEDEDMVWGVYVYLEGYGHVWCDDTYLAPGQTTDCWAADEV